MAEHGQECVVMAMAPHPTNRIWVRAAFTCGCFQSFCTRFQDPAAHARLWMEFRRDSAASQLRLLDGRTWDEAPEGWRAAP